MQPATLDYAKTNDTKPYVFVKLRRLGKELETLFLVDSGADYSIITAELAEELGIPLDRLPERKIRGIGGSIGLSSHEIEYEINGTKLRFQATTFFGRDYRGGVNLLGRKPLFSLCKVTFDDNGQKLSLLSHA